MAERRVSGQKRRRIGIVTCKKSAGLSAMHAFNKNWLNARHTLALMWCGYALQLLSERISQAVSIAVTVGLSRLHHCLSFAAAVG